MDEHRLDGNATGRVLDEIFGFEMTTAHVACASCGTLSRIGQAMVYGHGMGTIVRCARCDNALIRIAHPSGRYWLDLRGVRYLQVEEA